MTFKTFRISIFVIVCVVFIGCGKKENISSPSYEPVRPPITQIDQYLASQDVSCEGNQACPNYIAKIVVLHGNQYKFCTGFLTDKNVIATSSSCLPNFLRQAGQDCSRDIFFFFPKTVNRSGERFSCEKVIQISSLEGQDPILWRDNVSFLQLSGEVSSRRAAAIVRDGIENDRQFTAWMVDQQGDFSATIKRATCQSVHNNYINPLVANESSTNMLFADCAPTLGSTGAPIVDGRGKVRAMVSTGIDQQLRIYLEASGLLFNGLKDMVHATNFACAPFVGDDTYLDERECMKDLTYSKVDKLRSDMLDSSILFENLRKKLEETLSNVSRNVTFGFRFIPKGDIQETAIFPKCFKPFNNWLYRYGGKNVLVEEVILPTKTFRRAMDPYGRIQALTIDGPAKNVFVQYSLKYLRNTSNSYVMMWQSEEPFESFPGINLECGSALL